MNLHRPAYGLTTHFPNGARDEFIKNLTMSQPVAHINRSTDPLIKSAVVIPSLSLWTSGGGGLRGFRRGPRALRELRSQFGARFINRQAGVASA